MGRLVKFHSITMATTRTTTTTTTTLTFLFLLLTTSSVLARPHIKPALTLADIDLEDAIPKKNSLELSALAPWEDHNGGRGRGEDGGRGEAIEVDDAPKSVLNEIRFDAVDLPSHFETYDLNRDRRVSLNEVSIVTGTKEIDAIAPFHAADINNDEKISFEEFKNAPWIFGATREVEVVDEFIRELVGQDI